MNRFEQLDVNAFNRYYAGLEHGRSVQLYLKLGNLFLKGLSEKLVYLNSALEEGRAQDAKIMAHRIRGSLLSLGGTPLAQVFDSIEHGLDTENPASFLKLLHAKQHMMDQFQGELRVWMETLEVSVRPVA